MRYIFIRFFFTLNIDCGNCMSSTIVHDCAHSVLNYNEVTLLMLQCSNSPNTLISS